MKINLLLLGMALVSYTGYSQNSNPWPTTGNVGIGTTSPTSQLNISTVNASFKEGLNVDDIAVGGTAWGAFNTRGNATNIISGADATHHGYFNIGTSNDNGATQISRLFIDNVGSVGIGTTSPQTLLDVRGEVSIGYNATYGLRFYNEDRNNWSSIANTVATGSSRANLVFKDATGEVIRINEGNVVIGTTDPHGFKLAVNGSAIVTSVTVKNYIDWPDYVFKPEYKLPSLLDVKTYVDKNRHLPDMPSGQEIKDNGINLGEIVKVQTKKIEELTLYAIEQEKRIATLEAAILKLTANK